MQTIKKEVRGLTYRRNVMILLYTGAQLRNIFWVTVKFADWLAAKSYQRWFAATSRQKTRHYIVKSAVKR